LHEQFGYAYDAAGNLNYRTNNALTQTFAVNNLNELSNVTRSGTLTVAGTTMSTATNVTVNSTNAILYNDKSFAKEGFTVTNGNNAYTAIAQDSYNRKDTNSEQRSKGSVPSIDKSETRSVPAIDPVRSRKRKRVSPGYSSRRASRGACGRRRL